jgi:iron complex outermembrane receptor protein
MPRAPAALALGLAAAVPAAAQDSAPEAPSPPPLSDAQSSGAPPIGQADNAYGLRVGNEEIGLYDTESIRGFALDSGANYRLDGAFFSAFTERAGRSEASAAIQAGPNLFAARFPSPTGVVDLVTDHAASPPLNLILRADGFGSLEAVGRAAFQLSPDASIWAVGEGVRARNWHGGRDDFAYGAVGGAVSAGAWRFEGGSSIGRYSDTPPVAVYATVAPQDLPAFAPDTGAAPDWARTKGWETLSWGAAERALGDGWRARAALAYGTFATDREAFVFLDNVGADGVGTINASAFGETSGRAVSGEGLIERQWNAPHGPARVSFAVIGRDQRSDLSDARDVAGGAATIGGVLAIADPGAPDTLAARDAIREGRVAASASYPLARWLLVSGSVQRVHYTKAYTPISAGAGTTASPRTDREWAGHLAATVALADAVSVYGAWVTGLEESGTAPAIAVNANETLPALRATQREVGAKWRITPHATLLVSAFDITKGAPGFDNAGVWVLNGTRRHRGIEASLVAPIGPVQVVAGALYLDALITEASGLRAEVVNQPRWRGSVNAQWQATPRLAVDAGAYLLGAAPARRDGTATIPARTDLSLGVTWALGEGETAPTLRIAGSNLLDNRGWDANDDESLSAIESRAVRASLAFQW